MNLAPGQGSWIAKPIAPGVDGRMLVARVAMLRAAGLRVPAVRLDAPNRCLRIRRVAGVEGRALLHAATDGDAILRLFGRLTAPLIRLHALDPSPLALPAVDPGRRVRPRLQGGSALQLRAAELWATLAGPASSLTAPSRVLHGDYHPGQLIFGSRAGRPWLLDLDDMARGSPEVDYGNLVAYLASWPALAGEERGPLCDRLLSRLLAPGGSVRLEPGRLRLATTVALVRRALKLEERGADALLPADLLALAERLGAPDGRPGAASLGSSRPSPRT